MPCSTRNWWFKGDGAVLSISEYYIYNPADGSYSYSITKSQVPLPNDSIKEIDANKSIPKAKILDTMKILTVCWEEVTEETVKKCFAKCRISTKDQANVQNDLEDTFIELRSNMEAILAVAKVLKRLPRKNLQNSMIPLLQRNLFYLEFQSLQWCVGLGANRIIYDRSQ